MTRIFDPLSQSLSNSGPPNLILGILDSGVGGLSVLREVRAQMPWIDINYIGDTANVPYGDKPIPVVCDLAVRLSARLIEESAAAVIMASGTSTVAGLDAARELFPGTPIFGVIEPGARAAVNRCDGAIGVISTNATARSLAFTKAIREFDAGRDVIEVGCPRFVPLVETGQTESQDAVDACCDYLKPLVAANVSAVIYGCTHFPFLSRALSIALDRLGARNRPVFVDPAAEAVADILHALYPDGVSESLSRKPGVAHFSATGDPDLFAENASVLLGEKIAGVRKLELRAISYI